MSVLRWPLGSEDVLPERSRHMGGAVAASDHISDPRGQGTEPPSV